ncbi:MAG: DUF6090 family protein [Bacteroidota bacterium]
MIKFFRKIRQRLLIENKFSKYLFYAIGEIVLVVIGILIALWINNWNQEQKNMKLANVYLTDLRRDIKSDVKTLDDRIITNEGFINKIDSIIITVATRKELSKSELIVFINQNMELLHESYFIPEKSTIRQIEANSKGNLILNKVLRDKIFQYYTTNDRNEKNGEISLQLYQHNRYSQQIVDGALLGGESLEILIGNSLNRPFTDFSKLGQNTGYISAVGSKKVSTLNQNIKYKEIKVLAKDLLELLESELKNQKEL